MIDRTFGGNFAAESAGRLGRDGTEDELVGVRLIQLSDERIENDLMLHCYVKGLADWISIDSASTTAFFMMDYYTTIKRSYFYLRVGLHFLMFA